MTVLVTDDEIGKSWWREILAQILCQKTPTYFVYFQFFVSKSWGKRSANNRRRLNQRLL